MPQFSDSDEISTRREQIYSELVRANRAAVGIFSAVILLAIAIVLAAHNAQRHAAVAISAQAAAQQELWRAQLARARATRQSISMGRGVESWKAVTNAAVFKRDLDLRNEAIAALATPDIRQLPMAREFVPFKQNVTFDSSGERYLETSSDGVITLRRTSDNAPLWIVPSEDSKNWYSPGFSADGRWLFVMLADGTLVVWDLKTFARVKTISGNQLWSYSYSGDGRFACATSPDGIARLYNLPAWSVAAEFSGVTRDDDVSLSEDGSRVAIRPQTRNSVTIVDWAAPTDRLTLALPTPAFAIEWHPSGNLLACACMDQRIRIFDTRSGQELRTLSGHHSQPIQVAFVPGHPWLLSMSWDCTSRLWDTVAGEEVVRLPRYGDAAFLNGRNLQFGWRYENNSVLEIFQIEPSSVVRTVPQIVEPPEIRPGSCALSDDERFIATATPTGIRISDPASGALLKRVRSRDAFEPYYTKDGSLWFNSESRFFRVRPGADSAEEIPGIAGQRFRVNEDGSVIASLAGEKISVLRNDGARSWNSKQEAIETIALSPDGRWIATGTRTHVGIRVWDAGSGALLWKNNLRQGTAVEFTPDSRFLLTCTTEGYALWDVQSGKTIWQKGRGTDSIMSPRLAVSPDGKLMAVANTSTEAMLVDPATGEELAKLKSPNPRYIAYLNFSGAGKYFAVTYEDRSIQLWDLGRLRKELAAVGLDWGVRNTETQRPIAQTSPTMSRGFLILAVAGVIAAIAFGIGIFNRHRRLLRGYLEIEALAVRRQEQLRGAEKELARGQKMTALGTLAAGVAHDFNNLLSVIRMANTGIARTTRRSPEIVEDLQDIESAVVDGKRIVQSMLGYTRDGVGPAEMFAVAPLLEETVRLLTRQFLSGVQLHLNVETALPEVIGYPARLKQMLLNFVVNASEAMSGKGDLWIEARSVGEVAGELILEPSEASRFIAISVRDSGPGLDRQTRSRIFEPFFTTKNSATTRGTGLGLSVVYTMAEQDGLGLDCQSAPGQGATFTIFFPVQARDGSGSPTSADVGATHNSSDER